MRFDMTAHLLREYVGVVTRALGLASLVALLMLAGSGVENTPVRAQQAPSGSVIGSLRLAASGLGPVPTNSILPPDTLERIAERIRRKRWKVPTENKTWPMKHGKPVVTTPRLDELWHTVEAGQTLHRLHVMYKVRTRRLEALNPDVDLHHLESGERVLVWKRRPGHLAYSYGAPQWGRLYNGEPLPDDSHYVILYPHRTFGTYYTISEVKRVLDDFYEKYPDAPKIMVGDISFRRGRSMHPHVSHRSGRDIDISYPRRKAPDNFRRFHYVHRGGLDVKKTLSLIKDLVDGGYVEYIFMDHWLQKRLRKEALAEGATKAWVEKVFQYPHWHGTDALVRYAPGHRNHFHVRFKCQPTDHRCR